MAPASGLKLALLLVPISALKLQDDMYDDGPTSYFWPTPRGKISENGQSNYWGPLNGKDPLNSMVAWEWSPPIDEHLGTHGALIDDQKNVFISAGDGIHKFDEAGHTLWIHMPPDGSKIPTASAMSRGQIFGTTTSGHVFALDVRTGRTIWDVKVSKSISDDGSEVAAGSTVIVVATDAEGENNLNRVVRCLSSYDGSLMWLMETDAPLYKFAPNVHTDGSIYFQDVEGKAYRVDLVTGKSVWKAGGVPGTFSAGGVIVRNGTMFTTSLNGCCCGPCRASPTLMTDATTSTVYAYTIGNGHLKWKADIPRPVNVAPGYGDFLVGEYGQDKASMLVLPAGVPCSGQPTDIYRLDVLTGKGSLFWTSPNEPLAPLCPGFDLNSVDKHGKAMKKAINNHTCSVGSAASPTVAWDGTVFMGNQDGKFYALKDFDRDGIIGNETTPESARVDIGSTFSGHGSAHADGMIVAVHCEGLLALKHKKHVEKKPQAPTAKK